jgi:hypothetical protein
MIRLRMLFLSRICLSGITIQISFVAMKAMPQMLMFHTYTTGSSNCYMIVSTEGICTLYVDALRSVASVRDEYAYSFCHHEYAYSLFI